MKHLKFTLIELLIVISIIAILASILLPALKKARDKVYVINCTSNLKQCMLAQKLYTNDYNDYLPAIYYGDSCMGTTYVYWSKALEILKYIPGNMKNSFKKGVQNCPLAAKLTENNHRYNTSYGQVYCRKKTDSSNSYLKLSKVKKASKRFWLVDNYHYYATGGVDYIPNNNYYYGGNTVRMHMMHNGKGNIAYVDGHASSGFPKEIAKTVFSINAINNFYYYDTNGIPKVISK